MTSKYFGTDGIRGLVGSNKINPEQMLRLGWAAGMVFKQNKQDEILIGKDTRLSGYMIESALESGLAAAGMNVALLGPMPTPAIAYLTATFRCAAGIVISASHNSFEDNGVKFFAANGKKLSRDVELEIEKYMAMPMQLVAPRQIGKARRISGAPDRYIEFCKSKLIPESNLMGLNIVLDCANGATYNIAESVFTELGAKVTVINNKPDGFNINNECGSTNTAVLRQQLLILGADLAIAFDGDGDRCIMIDSNGDVIDGDDILYILALHAKQRNKLANTGIVGTLMSNYALEQSLAEAKIPFLRTLVGDRHVMAKLQETNWFIGGEPSGHILNTHKTLSGDGIITAILVLNAMLDSGKSLHELLQGFTKLPSRLINISCNCPTSVFTEDKIAKLEKIANDSMGNNGRVLLRPSGTEAKFRIMLECKDDVKLNSVAEQLIVEANNISIGNE